MTFRYLALQDLHVSPDRWFPAPADVVSGTTGLSLGYDTTHPLAPSTMLCHNGTESAQSILASSSMV